MRLIAAIELVKDKTTKEPYPWEEHVGIQVCLEPENKACLSDRWGTSLSSCRH